MANQHDEGTGTDTLAGATRDGKADAELPRRAFEARTFEEEKHVVLGKAYLALSVKYRLQELLGEGPPDEEGEGNNHDVGKARPTYSQGEVPGLTKQLEFLRQELEENLEKAASQEVLSDLEAMQTATSAVGRRLSRCNLEVDVIPEGPVHLTGRNAGKVDFIRRAFGALSFEEEVNALRGMAHLAVATKLNPTLFGGVDYRTGQEVDENVDLASDAVLDEKSTMLIVVKLNGEILSDCSAALKDDAEVVLEACRDFGFAMGFASQRIRDDRDIVLRAVSSCGFALSSASDRLKGDREVVLAAIQNQPLVFDSASLTLRKDRDLLLSALRSQTRTNVRDYAENVLQRVLIDVGHDREILLEAIRPDGAAVRFASAELQGDKDFILQAMRRASREDRQYCFEQAAEALRRSIPYDDFVGAADSPLALAGDAAPALTLSLSAGTTACRGEKPPSTGGSITRCEVTLMSGATFSWDFGTTSSNAAANANGTSQQQDNETDPQPPTKRARLPDNNEHSAQPTCTEQEGTPQTVADLAQEVLARYLQHVQVQLPPKRLFLMFDQANRGADAVLATPWDWNRLLTTFL